jgi:hypothetical protein
MLIRHIIIHKDKIAASQPPVAFFVYAVIMLHAGDGASERERCRFAITDFSIIAPVDADIIIATPRRYSPPSPQ